MLSVRCDISEACAPAARFRTSFWTDKSSWRFRGRQAATSNAESLVVALRAGMALYVMQPVVP